MNKETENLNKSGREQLSKLRHIVQKSIDEEKLVVENLLNEPKEMLTRGQSISDKVARFGGSWSFILSFSAILFVWIVFNSYASGSRRFDPYPFILMNLILSTVAALQAPGATHVGIAISPEQFVHAPSSSGVVRVESLAASYWSSRLVGTRRIP